MKDAFVKMWSRTPPSGTPKVRRRFEGRSDAVARHDHTPEAEKLLLKQKGQ